MRKRLFAFVSILLAVVLLNITVLPALASDVKSNSPSQQTENGIYEIPDNTETEYNTVEKEQPGEEDQVQSPTGEDEGSVAEDAVGFISNEAGKPLTDESGAILLYNFDDLLLLGSRTTITDSAGQAEPVIYSQDADYRLAEDIYLPAGTLWKLPEEFTGRIIPAETDTKPLYDESTDTIYIYNPYQLAVMQMEDAYLQPVLSGDALAKEFGTGQPLAVSEGSEEVLTYGPEHNYVISKAFDSTIQEPSVSVRKKAAKLMAAGDSSDLSDGRDFPGQVIKKLGGVTYILIGNEEQLRAIGTDAEVFTPVYQTDYKLIQGHVLDTDSEGRLIQLYGGDADLAEQHNGYRDYGFQQVNDRTQAGRYYVGVNQETGEPYTDALHATLNKNSLTEASWRTGEKYSISANYIIFRDIELGGAQAPWTPLMFNGTMYGARSISGEKLWDGGITDSTALTALDADHRPVISDIYVNKNTILNVNEHTGVGFFATVTNRTNASNIGLSGGTAEVKNIELCNVHVENNTSQSGINQTILNAVTSALGSLLGNVLNTLLYILSFGSVNTDLGTTLSNLLNARRDDPTIFATGAFAGRVYGDAIIEDCVVGGTVEVSNVNDRTGGFAGYTEGMTEYSGLSRVLGGVSGALSQILNVIPAVGVGDLITILLGNAIPLKDLIPTGYIAPTIKNCEVNGLTRDIGTPGTDFAGGFVGQQIGTRIEGCRITGSSYNVNVMNYGGGFAGLERDANIKGTLDGLGVDLSSLIPNIHPQSVLVDCEITDSEYSVTGDTCLGGFTGAMTSSYAVDCTINCPQSAVTVTGSGEYAGGFAGYATVGWQSSLGKDDNDENSLLGTVKQIALGLLSTDKSAGQKLLTLMGVSPSAILGSQMSCGRLDVEAAEGFAGGIVGKGEGIYLSSSVSDAYDRIAAWNTGTLKETPHNRPVILDGLGTVRSGNDYAGGVAGYMGSAAFEGLLNDVVGLGDFIGFAINEVSVNGIDGGYSVNAENYDAGGGIGYAVGGTMTNVKLNKLKEVNAFNRAGGFAGIAGPGELTGTNGLTVNLLGLDRVLEVSNLLNIGQGIEVHITDCDVTGIPGGYTVEAVGSNAGNDVNEFTAAGFISDSNSTKITNSHCHNLLSVKASADHGFAGGFVGTSETGGLAEVADNDATAVKKLIEANGLLRAIEYLLPEYTDCTVSFADGGFVDSDIAGGFAADFAGGTADNSGTGNYAVYNVDKVHGRTYAGGYGGRIRSGALASAAGGISILGDSALGLNIDISNLLSILNVYVPVIENAGVYSENGFTVDADRIKGDDIASGSAGGFCGYMSGAQIKNSDVYRLKHTEVTPPDDLEAVEAPSYFDEAQSSYAVKGAHFAGGYVGKMDIGSAASLGGGLKVLGSSISLTDMLTALSVVASTIEHSDVEGMPGGFSVLSDADDTTGKVGMAGGYAGGIYGGHIQNSHCKNFYYVIGQEAAGGYVGNMEPGDAARLLDNGSVLGLINIDSALASLVEDFVPTIRNSTSSCVPCGGAVRAHSPSDNEIQRGSAGGFAGHNEGGHIWGLSSAGGYTGEQHECAAYRIRSVYGYEYAGGFTGFMESADTAATGSISLLGGLISADNVLSALSVIYPTQENTAVYGPLRGLDDNTWNAWAEYVGKYGGYGAELARGQLSEQDKEKYYYGCNVVAGRTTHDNMLISEGGNAGGYVGYMVTGVITNGQSHDMKKVRAMRSAGGFAGKMQTGAAASFGSVSILGLNLNAGKLLQAVEAFVPTVRVSSTEGYQSGMTVESFGTDAVQTAGNAGGFAGAAYGVQIWGDLNADGSEGAGCNVSNLRFVRGKNGAGGYVGLAEAASVADLNTNASDGFLQQLLNRLISDPNNLATVMQATVTTIRKAEVNPDDPVFGFVVEGVGGTLPRFAGGFAGSLEAAVIGSRTGETGISVNGVRSVDGLYYAGGFFGLADVGSVANVSGTQVAGGVTSILSLIRAGNVDVLDVFRTYIYHSDVNGVAEGLVVNTTSSAQEGILSENRSSGCSGGFGGGLMNGTVKSSSVNNLSTVSGPNYNGGFIGHMGKNGGVDVDSAAVTGLVGLTAGVLDIFGATVDDCHVRGVDYSDGSVINNGAVIFASGGEEPVAGGFTGYADVSRIDNSSVTGLKWVNSDGTAGGFVGKTNMNYLVEAEADSALVQIVLGILNTLLRILQIDRLENLDLINTDSWLDNSLVTNLLGLKLLSDGELLYVNLLGLRVGVSLVQPDRAAGSTGTLVVTIGDSSVELPYNENGIDTSGENAELVINLIKGNRTQIDNCYVKGISTGYDVYGGGATNDADGTAPDGYAGGFVGYNKEGKFTSNRMEYCDVVRGTEEMTGPFSGTTYLESVYSFNTLASIEKEDGAENVYSVYRATDLVYVLTDTNAQIGAEGVDDTGQATDYKRFDVVHLAEPVSPGTNEPYFKIFEKWDGAVLASDTAGTDSVPAGVYESSAKAVLMRDMPARANDESLVPIPGETSDPCDEFIGLTIQKQWDDWNNFGGGRPDSIRVRIMQHWKHGDGSPVLDRESPKVVAYTDTSFVSGMDSNGWFGINVTDHGRAGSSAWTRVIEGLPVYTVLADETIYFEYTVEEEAVDGYDTSIRYDSTGKTRTATIRNKTRSVLPFTGSGTDLVFILIGIGVIISAILLLKRRSNKNTNHV